MFLVIEQHIININQIRMIYIKPGDKTAGQKPVARIWLGESGDPDLEIANTADIETLLYWLWLGKEEEEANRYDIRWPQLWCESAAQ